MQQTAVVIVDSHPIMRDGLALRLLEEPDLRVLAKASTRSEVVRLTVKHRPDVLILDADIGDDSCAELLGNLRAMTPHPAVILLTSHNDATSTTAAILMGASGCVLVMDPIEDLITAIRWVGRGEMWISPPLLAGMATEFQGPVRTNQFSNRLDSLTPREMEILSLMVEGLNHAELARRLHVTVNTIRTHTSNLQMKLDVHSNLSAVAMALRAGIRPNDMEPLRETQA